MASLSEHLDTLRAKPHHIRHRIALGISSGVTALVVVVWAMTLVTSGALAPKAPATFAAGDGTPEAEVGKAVTQTTSAFSDLMGAAGAAFGATSTAAALTIIQTRASSTMDTKTDNNTTKTVIPF